LGKPRKMLGINLPWLILSIEGTVIQESG